jgi:uncharacterized membrane protein YvbJ
MPAKAPRRQEMKKALLLCKIPAEGPPPQARLKKKPPVNPLSMKAPRFFCENCGAEVSRDAKNCPQCGRFFASVRCPSCGFTGAEGLFGGGCPVCGYSAPKGTDKPERFKKKDTRVAAGALPMWVYVLSLLALIFVAVILYFVIKN